MSNDGQINEPTKQQWNAVTMIDQPSSSANMIIDQVLTTQWNNIGNLVKFGFFPN